MGNIVASAFSAYRGVNEWWQSLEPSGLVVAFCVVVVFVSAALWHTCRARSSVFWKRTDYAYFFFVILGGVVGAADLAVTSLNKELAQIQMNLLTNSMVLREDVSSALSICAKRQRPFEEFDPEVIKPVLPSKRPTLKELSFKNDCATVALIKSDIEKERLETAVKYGVENRIGKTAIDEHEIFKNWELADTKLADTDFMPTIAASIGRIVDARAREHTIKEKLSASSYAYSSVLKSWWPILLRLGIGIRLTRTHYDAKAENGKEKEKARNDLKKEEGKQKSGS
jgi:hypothetical protein